MSNCGQNSAASNMCRTAENTNRRASTEQGSSASQMTAAKVMDIISRLPGCAGQAADAVSAYTQVKNGRCSKITENSQIGMSRHLD